MFAPTGYSTSRDGNLKSEEKAALQEDWAELGRILLAGGCAGSLSAIIPCPPRLAASSSSLR